MTSHTIILDSSNLTRLETIIYKIFEHNIDIDSNHPDILKLGNLEEINSIKINEIKYLKQWIKLKPFQEKSKVAIIYNAELLTIEAQNSLLKVLEEPPKNSYIILITNNHKALLNTVLSRAELEISTSSAQRNNFNDNQAIFLSTLDIQFQWIDDLFRSKNPHQRKKTVKQLIIQIKNWLIQNQDTNTKNNLELLEKSADALNKNISVKLILENLFLNLLINNNAHEKIQIRNDNYS